MLKTNLKSPPLYIRKNKSWLLWLWLGTGHNVLFLFAFASCKDTNLFITCKVHHTKLSR